MTSNDQPEMRYDITALFPGSDQATTFFHDLDEEAAHRELATIQNALTSDHNARVTAYDHTIRSLIRLDLAEIITMRPAT